MLTKAEQAVASSGLPYAVIRAWGIEDAGDSLAAVQGIKVDTVGTISPSLFTSKKQVTIVRFGPWELPGLWRHNGIGDQGNQLQYWALVVVPLHLMMYSSPAAPRMLAVGGGLLGAEAASVRVWVHARSGLRP